MAEPGSLKVGDTVTHPDWPNGQHRKVVSIKPFKPHPKMPKSGGGPKFVIELDEPAFEKGFDRDGFARSFSAKEQDLNRFWMEAGLLKVV